MAIRSLANQQIHDELIVRLFEEVSEKGYENVRASHIELPEDRKPEKIYSEQAEMFFCPDVYAERGGIAYIFEVETVDSIASSLTRVELEAFATHAKDYEAYLYLVVPEEIQKKAKTVIEGINKRNKRKSFVLTI